eukprot:15342944-Ditylum_brightwellii.AAC.1
MLQQYQDGREMCTLQQSFMVTTQQLRSTIQVASALCSSGGDSSKSNIAAEVLQTFDRQEGSVAKSAKTEKKLVYPSLLLQV